MTKEPTLEQRLKACALFDGWQLITHENINKPFYEHPKYKREFTDYWIDGIYGWKYNKSYDWLMPLVEEIEALGYNVNINTMSSISNNTGNKEVIHLVWNSNFSKIESLFMAVSSFCLEWCKLNNKVI